jgi:hypothetical protein
MLSLSNIRTSQIETLKDQLTAGDGVKEFVDACYRFLNGVTDDQGADSDLVYMTGKRLSSHDVWSKVPAPALGMALRGIPRATIDVFLEHALEGYRNIVVRQASKEPSTIQNMQRGGWTFVEVSRGQHEISQRPSGDPHPSVGSGIIDHPLGTLDHPLRPLDYPLATVNLPPSRSLTASIELARGRIDYLVNSAALLVTPVKRAEEDVASRSIAKVVGRLGASKPSSNRARSKP